MITAGEAGSWTTGILSVLAIGYGISEIFLTVRQNRRRQKIESERSLNAKLDAWTEKNGLRSEDPDDVVRRRA